MKVSKAELVKSVEKIVGDLMLVVLAAYEPLSEDEWYVMTRLAFEDASALPDPETFDNSVPMEPSGTDKWKRQ